MPRQSIPCSSLTSRDTKRLSGSLHSPGELSELVILPDRMAGFKPHVDLMIRDIRIQPLLLCHLKQSRGPCRVTA
jgi:hypothetical protein